MGFGAVATQCLGIVVGAVERVFEKHSRNDLFASQ